MKIIKRMLAILVAMYGIAIVIITIAYEINLMSSAPPNLLDFANPLFENFFTAVPMAFLIIFCIALYVVTVPMIEMIILAWVFNWLMD